MLNSEERTRVSFVDISRAYFNTKIDPDDPTYVALPAEEPDSDKGPCGPLPRHRCGTQKAAEELQTEYSQTLIDLGLQQGVACPCICHHATRGIARTVNGDDLTAVGIKRLWTGTRSPSSTSTY